MIKAVFLDIDGTMVPFGEKEIRPSLIDAFDRLHEAGIKVIVASGRSRLLIKNLRDYPFDEPDGTDPSRHTLRKQPVLSTSDHGNPTRKSQVFPLEKKSLGIPWRSGG